MNDPEHGPYLPPPPEQKLDLVGYTLPLWVVVAGMVGAVVLGLLLAEVTG